LIPACNIGSSVKGVHQAERHFIVGGSRGGSANLCKLRAVSFNSHEGSVIYTVAVFLGTAFFVIASLLFFIYAILQFQKLPIDG
jgi:hypothetical protein